MDRRGFTSLVGRGILAMPLAAEAQQAANRPRLGYLVLPPLSETPSPERAAFLEGLRELGWIDGKTIAIEYRSAQWNVEFLDDLAQELVRMKVDIIIPVGGSQALTAATRATSTIPIVITGSADPVAQRIVSSLGRPGGNVTGMSTMTLELSSKRLELLKEVVPRVARLAVLWTPGSVLEMQATRTAAPKFGLTLKLMQVQNTDDLARTFSVLEKERPDALTMLFDALTTGYRELVADFARRRKLPTVFGGREFAEAGGLMSYAPNIPEGFHRAAYYVDRILKGAKPGDLPIEQPTKFELVINLKTAKALGLTIPQSILLRADQVIE